MWIFFGKRKYKLRKITDHSTACEMCEGKSVEIKISQMFWHIFFIPLVSAGEKTSEIICHNCGALYEIFSNKYSDSIRRPLRFYSVQIFISLFILFIVFGYITAQKEKKLFIENPQIGDVYLIRDEGESSKTYYYFKVVNFQKNADKINVIHSAFEYDRYVSKMDAEDYFVKNDILQIPKKNLKKMLEDGFINAVERGYSRDSRFQIER